MSHSPTPDRDPQSDASSQQPAPRRWRRIALPLGIAALAGAGGGGFWAWRTLHEQLPTIVAKNLSETLHRPVQVGALRGLNLSGLVIGESAIPATPTDADNASVREIQVGFDLWQTILTRKLKLDITLKDAVVFLEQEKAGWVNLDIKPQEEGFIELGTIRAENATAQLLGLGTVGGKRAIVQFNDLDGRVNIFDKSKRFAYDLTGEAATGGTFKLMGETMMPSQKTQLQVQAANFLVADVDRLLNLPFDLPTGRGGGTFKVELDPAVKNPPIYGVANFSGVTLAIPEIPRPFTQAKGTLRFQGSQVMPEAVVGTYGKATGTVNGAIDLNRGFNLTAQVKPLPLPDLIETLKVSSPVPLKGLVTAKLKVTGSMDAPVLSGTAQNVGTTTVDRVPVDRFNVAFKLDTTQAEIVVQQLQASLKPGGQITGSGRVDLSQTDAAGAPNPGLAFNVLAQNLPGDAIATLYNNGTPPPVKVGTINAQAQLTGSATAPVTRIQWTAPEALYAGAGEIQITNGAIALTNTTFQVEGGTVAVRAIAQENRWQANLNGTGIDLKRFSPELRGSFNGDFVASGSLSSFSPADIRAQGTATLSEGIAIIEQPLVAQVKWDGQKVLLQQATAPGFRADGTIAVNLEGTPSIQNFDLNVSLTDYNLRDFPVDLPSAVAYSGRTDFTGRITGTPTAPKLDGKLALRDLVVNGIAFEPSLSGRVQYGQGVRLDLRGDQDRIAAVLDRQLQPVAFEVRRGEAIATGRSSGTNLLLVDVKNVPLSLAQLPNTDPNFAPDGTLNGSFAVDLKRQTANGEVVIAQPRLGTYRADEFRGRVNYANGIASLIDGQLKRGETIVQIDGSANLLAADPQFKAQIEIAQAQIQEVLTGLQLFDLEDFQRGTTPPDYGTAADLETVPINTLQVAIQKQLQRLAEIQAMQSMQQADAEAQVIPALSELTGQFAGTISVTGSLSKGINSSFNIRGQDFKWGRFEAREVIALGGFQNGELTLLPLRLQADDRILAFSGKLFGENQSGQLRIENFPVEQLTDLVQLPIQVKGRLNATATISGSFNNPQAVGDYRLLDAQLNGTAAQKVQGTFTYANARLDFSNTFAIVETEPLSIVGSVPLPLFGTEADREPLAPGEADRISLDIKVKNEGLAMLNSFTDQVSWVSGKGEAEVRVRGTLQAPIAVGQVKVENATIAARALPEPLTNVNGTIAFVQDRVRVPSLTGDFSKGKITATGVIPLANRLESGDPDLENPLTVNMEKIALSLKGLYRGNVDGDVIVAGTVLEPTIGGGVRLSNGQVLLSPDAVPVSDTAASGNTNQSPVEFANLKLTLGDRVILTSPPIISFTAQGDLYINGDLTQPDPSGVIQLRSGQVNLFTTQFTLDRGYTQTAEFVAGRGLDPELNVRLVALVPEVRNQRQPSVLTPSEVLDVPAPASSLGALQTVRVRAEVRGPASRLSDNLELTSSPPRSESEIVALIGGGYVATLGRGDTLTGLANLAGSALLSNVQTTIGRALGLSEFRLFPTFTQDTGRNSNTNTSTLGLAAEAAVDITPSLSVGALKILTNNEPAQFGLRYRLNGNTLLRGSTNFSGDTRAAVEYELRF